MLFFQRSIFRIIFEIEVLELGPFSWFGGVVGLAHHLWPVDDGSSQITDVHVVEFVLERPGLFGIVDFEFDVGGYPAIMSCQCT